VTTRRLSGPLTFLMSMSVGTIVANLYYLQPLLHQVRHDFATSTVQTLLLVTFVQGGYAFGLLFIVPLGDLLARRRLIVTIFFVAAASMALASLAHSYALFAALTVLVGLTSVGGQVLIPFGADLAPEGQRGRVVARLMSGLLMGILLSRTFSGIGAEIVGWRGVYVAAAILLAVMAVVLSRVLPDEGPRDRVPYSQLIASLFHLLFSSREIRRRCWLAATCFGAFSVLWSTLAFHLSAAPFHYSNIEIGLFGLLGVGGVMAANVAGRLADQKRNQSATTISGALIVLSFALMWVGRDNAWLLAFAIFLLDAGLQGAQITSQTIIYALTPGTRSRTTSIFMVSFFIGGALGSLAASFTYAQHGWGGVCVLGMVIGLLALVPALVWRPAAISAS
jgi:predicted MFS family arabinose efflux permease